MPTESTPADESHGMLHLRTLGFDIDTNAPNFFPDNLRMVRVMVEPEWDLTATQRGVRVNHPALVDFRLDLVEGDDPIALVEVDGALYITEGHHRLAAARRAGVTVPADLWYAED